MTINERVELFDGLTKDIVPEKSRKWLIENKFFFQPASTKYHLAYEGGLFEHSLNVTMALLELTANNELKWEKKESPIIVGMFHDLCKIDNYMITFKDGKYTFVYNDSAPKGHGDKSVEYVKKYIFSERGLTEEEEDCIRWHMGAFDDKDNWSKYSDAILRHSTVLWTHTADMIASKIMEK